MEGVQNQEVNINEQREQFLAELEAQIDTAYENRTKETLVPGKKNTVEGMNEARREKATIQKFFGEDQTVSSSKEEGTLTKGEFVPLPNAVYTLNSHDYPDLFRRCLQKLVREGKKLSEDRIKEIMHAQLEHEYQHHVPALDQEGLTVRYAVKFYENNKSGVVDIVPFIELEGKLTERVYQNVLNAATVSSATDKIKMESSFWGDLVNGLKRW